MSKPKRIKRKEAKRQQRDRLRRRLANLNKGGRSHGRRHFLNSLHD